MRVRVLFFGVLKEVTGRAEEVLELEEGARLETVFERCAERYPRMREMAPSILMARNQQFAARAAAAADGDEVALLPPVSGGAGHFFALTRRPIDTAELKARLLEGEDGAVVCFEGVARNNTGGRATRYLDYDAYEPMALRAIEQIGQELARSYEIGRIGIVHRLGRVEIGETSVAIVVTAPHREAAFQAALEAINRLKRRAPIWKKETFADGEVWVEGEWDPSALEP